MKMSESLKKWVRILLVEKPDNTKGRPVPRQIWDEATLYMLQNHPSSKHFANAALMKVTQTDNMLFCGHFIYPDEGTNI